jgi:uncharacterized SAM-binding protein YcdF (DUF218 family)
MLSTVATVLLVPPVNLVVVALAGLALQRRRPAAGRRLLLGALLALLLLALPAVADLLTRGLEQGIAPDGAHPAPQAIVILGADAVTAGPSPDAVTAGPSPDAVTAGPGPDRTEVGGLTLQRLRVGAALARSTRLPVLVTGGVVSAIGPPVAELMAQSLAEDFAVPVRWVEPAAATTWENAAFSAKILRPQGIGTVLLVTHAFHMRRALIAFRAAGLVAVPAPLLAEPAWHPMPGSFVPRVRAWLASYYALHEWIGCAWYALKAAGGAPGG